MTVSTKVEIQKGFLDIYGLYLARTSAKNSTLIAENTRQQLNGLASISNGLERLKGEIAVQTDMLKKIQDDTHKIAINSEITALLARKDNEEKMAQKGIKNAVFAFKQDFSLTKKTLAGVPLYFKLSGLTRFASLSLVEYINELEEIADKEYATGLLNEVFNELVATYEALTEIELMDLLQFENLTEKLSDCEANLTELESRLNIEQVEITNVVSEIDDLQLQLNHMLEKNSNRPSRIFAMLKLIFALIVAFFVVLLGAGFPLLLLFVGGVRSFFRGNYSAIVSKPIKTNVLENDISTLNKNLEQKGQIVKVVESEQRGVHGEQKAIEAELNVMFQKCGLI